MARRGRRGAALTAHPQAIESDAGNHVLYSNRSAAYLALKRHEDALRDAEKCVELNMDWPKGYARQGAALQALGRYAEAEACYQMGAFLLLALRAGGTGPDAAASFAAPPGLVMSPGNAVLERGLAALQKMSGTGEDGDAAGGDGDAGAGGGSGAAGAGADAGTAAASASSGAETEGATTDRKSRAGELKGEGNKLFKAKDYSGAIACFSKVRHEAACVCVWC